MSQRSLRKALAVVVLLGLLVLGGCGTEEDTTQVDSAVQEAAVKTEPEEELSPKDPNQALLDAVDAHDVEGAREALERGADTEVRCETGWTATYRLALGDNVEMLGLLLEYGADVNGRDEVGQTALHMAVVAGYPDTVQMLIDNGADLEAQRDAVLFTPLYVCAISGDARIAQMLIDAGANVNAADINGHTPLAAAMENGNSAVADVLKNAGAE